jgi:two-component system sensor histidine kinase KdpD
LAFGAGAEQSLYLFYFRSGTIAADRDLIPADSQGNRRMRIISWLTHLVPAALPNGVRLALTVVACAGTTVLATPLLAYLDPANIVMLFLLTVLLVAVSLGLAPALLAAFLSVGLFDFFFVPPRFTFAVNDGQYLVTFAVMLLVAVVAGQLTAGLRRQADDSATEERRTRALYEMARDLSGALMLEQVVEITRHFLRDVLNADAVVLLADQTGGLLPCPGNETDETALVHIEPRFANIAFQRGTPASCEQLVASGYAVLYLPLKAPMRVRGVIAVRPLATSPDVLLGQRERLETMASLVAIAVERVHYVEVAQRTQVQIVSERLRSSILSALSHDLRTPLTALVGLADSLTMNKPPLDPVSQETAEAIREQAERLAGLVGNLLDMARLHAGDITLQKEWQPIEEVIGSSIKLLGRALAEHPVKVALAADLPLVEFDAVLIERVFCNLLENAAKYSPAGSDIEIAVRVQAAELEVSVSDHGQGFGSDKNAMVFEMFVRGDPESSVPGVGLGLAICRAIVEAHAGTIAIADRAGGGGGACVTFTLPLGEPPIIEEEVIPQEA